MTSRYERSHTHRQTTWVTATASSTRKSDKQTQTAMQRDNTIQLEKHTYVEVIVWSDAASDETQEEVDVAGQS